MEKESFSVFISSLKDSIRTWDYFVNWEKVFRNSSELEIALNKLNYLLGKQDLKSELQALYANNPDIKRALPILLAVRESRLEVYDALSRETDTYDFESERMDAERLYEFLEKSGLSKLFREERIKNLVDYVLGVEVGLDSNGRKNRGGTIMESIVEEHLKDFCSRNGLEYLRQANAAQIKAKWGYTVEVDKSSRNFDMAIFNPNTQKLKIFETNFYNGGGSKLKAVCGEFKGLNDELSRQGIGFVWITDGSGWLTTKRPLEETYNHNDHTFNLRMVEDGALEKLDW